MALSDIPQGKVSIAERVRKLTLFESLTGAHVLGSNLFLISGEEAVWRVAEGGEPERIALHGGGILCSACDGKRILTGGDDGKVMELRADGTHDVLAIDAKRRWIDQVALHPDGAIAWSAGKTAFMRAPKGEVKSCDVGSTVGGLAFAPKGMRLAIAHYNGVTLWFPNVAGTPDVLNWKGSHLGVAFSPDGKFVCSTMHEAALHGWRLNDGRNMRMSGYPSRVKSYNWSADGRWMATSGADAVILWPFQTKDGPLGKQPQQHAPLPARVSVVACHPKEDMLAAGYNDGTLLLVRISDGAEILVREPDGQPVVALVVECARRSARLRLREGRGGNRVGGVKVAAVSVMAALVHRHPFELNRTLLRHARACPAYPRFRNHTATRAEMTGTSPVMTAEHLAGRDAEV